MTGNHESYGGDQIVRDVALRVDIVDVIGETVSLTRKGNKHWGLCPFHDEKTPSFTVDQGKQMFYCHGCHAGGDVFTYLMRHRGIGFKVALEQLAERAGVALPQYQKGGRKDSALARLTQQTAKYYRRLLTGLSGAGARAYLQQRGVDEVTAQKFYLGYAGADWTELTETLQQQGFSPAILLRSGLAKQSQNGRLYDFFRDRLMFPIMMYDEDAVAFGGRVLQPEQQPKYLNSPETELFSKRKTLYGLFQARDAIRQKNAAILVEGYMDCVKMHRYGLTNVVASLGTAFTAEQAALLRRYAETVIVVYDGDTAGQRQTWRALDLLQQEGLRAETLVLPDGLDPDDFVERYKGEGFTAFLEKNRQRAIEFKLSQLLIQEGKLDSLKKTRVISQLFPDWQRLGNEIEREDVVSLLAAKLKLPENTIQKELQRLNPENRSSPQNRNKSPKNWDNKSQTQYTVADRVLACMINNQSLFDLVNRQIGLKLFRDEHYQQLLDLFAVLMENNAETAVSELRLQAAQAGLESRLAKLMMWEPSDSDHIYIKDFIAQVRAMRVAGRWSRLLQEIADTKGADYDRLASLLRKINQQLILTRGGGI